MTYKMEDYEIEVEGEVTNIAFGTTADSAYGLYLAKKKKIADLEYECELLVDKYHSEMCHSHIPPQFRQDIIEDLFAKDKSISNAARTLFLTLVFSDDFLQKHSIVFKELMWQGYERTGAVIMLDIDGCDYYYSVEIPCPNNIKKDVTRKSLMGKVKFRVDRIAKSKWENHVKVWEAVMMPTYDWKKCFEAIEVDVAQKGKDDSK